MCLPEMRVGQCGGGGGEGRGGYPLFSSQLRRWVEGAHVSIVQEVVEMICKRLRWGQPLPLFGIACQPLPLVAKAIHSGFRCVSSGPTGRGFMDGFCPRITPSLHSGFIQGYYRALPPGELSAHCLNLPDRFRRAVRFVPRSDRVEKKQLQNLRLRMWQKARQTLLKMTRF